MNGADPTGQVTGTTLGGISTSRTYNAFGEPARDTAQFSGATLYDAVYDETANPRDRLGRIQHLTETIQGVTRVYDYNYDVRGRLTGVQIDGAATRTYTWDDNGNRLTKTEGASTTFYVYDDQDRLLCERASAGTDCAGASVSYGWTANGELATKQDATGTTTYRYDELGNLRAVLLPSGDQIDYLIDGANRRVGRKLNGVLTNAWLYRNSLKPVAELDGSGNVVSRFVYGSKGQVPDFIVKGGVTYRVVSDHLGTPRLIVDQATGTVAQRIDADEWGVVVSDSNPGFQPFGFDGGLFDGATGLVRFGARDYQASVGRWTAKDPARFHGGLNFYKFAADDPVNFVDPTGLIDEASILNGEKALAAAAAGFGDALTSGFGLTHLVGLPGLTEWLNSGCETEHFTGKGTSAYNFGWHAGEAWGVVTGGALAVEYATAAEEAAAAADEAEEAEAAAQQAWRDAARTGRAPGEVIEGGGTGNGTPVGPLRILPPPE